MIHHPDRGSRSLSIRYTEYLAEAGIAISAGSVGDRCDNALAESVIGLFRTGVIGFFGPWKSVARVEWATLQWVIWYNTGRLHGAIGHRPPREMEDAFHAGRNALDRVARVLNRKISGKPGAVHSVIGTPVCSGLFARSGAQAPCWFCQQPTLRPCNCTSTGLARSMIPRIGISLVQVSRVLDGDSTSLGPTLAAHQVDLEGQTDRLAATIERVRVLRAGLADGQTPAVSGLQRMVWPAKATTIAFDLPWPWCGERLSDRSTTSPFRSEVVRPGWPERSLRHCRTRFSWVSSAKPRHCHHGRDRSMPP